MELTIYTVNINMVSSLEVFLRYGHSLEGRRFCISIFLFQMGVWEKSVTFKSLTNVYFCCVESAIPQTLNITIIIISHLIYIDIAQSKTLLVITDIPNHSLYLVI